MSKHEQHQLLMDQDIDLTEETVQKMDKTGQDQAKRNQKKLIDFDLQYSINNDHFQVLPALKKTKIENEKFDDLMVKLPKDMQNAAQSIRDYMNTELSVWDVKENKQGQINFSFNLPPSGFLTEKPVINLVQLDEMQHEYNYVQPFNKSQLTQIKETGTFETPSKIFPIPYVWKISGWIVKGMQPIRKSLNHDLALSYDQVLQIKERLKYKQPKNYKDFINYPSVTRGLQQVALFFPKIVQLFVGFKNNFSDFDQNKCEYKIEEIRQTEIQDLEDQQLALFEFLSVTDLQNEKQRQQLDKNYQILKDILKNFQKIQQDICIEIDDAYDENVQKQEQVFEKDLDEEKEQIENNKENFQTNYLDYFKLQIDFQKQKNQTVEEVKRQIIRKLIENNKQLNEEVKSHLINLILWNETLRLNFNKQQQQLQEKRLEIISKIEKEHPIKSLVSLFMKNEIQTRMHPFIQESNFQFQEDMKNSLQDLQLQALYKHYVKFDECHDTLFKQFYQKLEKKYEKPSREFILHQNLFPPYEVEKSTYNAQSNYRLVKDKEHKLDTNHYLWKIHLLFLRWYVWSMNTLIFLFFSAIVGPFGIRALFGSKPFSVGQRCDPRTGVVKNNQYTYATVLSAFFKVQEGMKKSRRDFESRPDTGLFGKNFARIWNYLEVYLFRFVLAGILICLFLFPMTIIVYSSAALILSITSWAWMPLVLMVNYLFNILIYDLDGLQCYRVKNQLIRNARVFPLLQEIYQMVFKGILQIIISIISAIVIHPFSAIFMVIFGYSRFFMRSLYDTLMMKIVRCMGRVPASENKLAWKISGPNVSRKFYSEISNEDLFILIQADLEKQLLRTYQKMQEQKILQPQIHSQDIMTGFFSAFNAYKQFCDPGVNLLTEELNRVIHKRMQIYPNFHGGNVRFTQTELTYLLRLTKQFIKHQIILKDMGNYIWQNYQIKKGDYNALTRAIWCKAFQTQDVLDPIEDLDLRFKLVETEGSRIALEQIRQALKGSVQLENIGQPTVTPKITRKDETFLRYFNFEQVIQQALIVQNPTIQWSAHLDSRLIAYINYNYRQKKEIAKLRKKQIRDQ